MKNHGKLILTRFGSKNSFIEGYSLVQLIETSSITGHFSEQWKTAYINIFSCKNFNEKSAKKFTKQFFGAKKITSKFIIR